MQTIRVAHSPDSDDAFMFYALATRKIDTGGLRYEHTLSDIETLNRQALEGKSPYEISAVSFHAYAYLTDRYALLSSGGSLGRNYGPVVVSRRPLAATDLASKTIAVPGTLTTAYLVLRLFSPDFQYKVVPFDRILDSMAKGDYDVGLLIHEGQLTYRDQGFHKVVDLGEWWQERTHLPLPLGCNVIRRDLGENLMRRIGGHLRDSIQYALDHRNEAMEYALSFSRGLDEQRVDRFVGMYVNDLTLDYGEDGREGIRRLMAEAFEKGLIPQAPEVRFV